MRNLSREDRQGVWIWVAVGAVVALVVGAYAYVKATRVRTDSASCVLADGSNRVLAPLAQTVFLIDQSEAFTQNQQNIILQRIHTDLFDSLNAGDRVMVFTFSKNSYFDLVPVFSQCVPPKDVNPLIGSRSRVKYFLEAKFDRPLLKAVNAGFQEIGDESPILEAIQDVGRSNYIDKRPGSSVRLIVVSDMLQHRAGKYTHYGHRPDFAAFRDSAYGRSVQANLSGWNVAVYYVARFGNGKADQGIEHMKFWQQYFLTSGAKLASWEPVI